MNAQSCINELQLTLKFFETSTNCLTEEDSSFRPAPQAFSAAEQVAHAAQTVDWFFNGAFGSGFDHDFKTMEEEIRKVTSLNTARKMMRDAISRGCALLESKSESELAEKMREGDILGGAPKYAIISAIVDHTAHHRGALTVYSRLLGKTPAMPYL